MCLLIQIVLIKLNKKVFGEKKNLLSKIQRKYDAFHAVEASMVLGDTRCTYMKNLETIQSSKVWPCNRQQIKVTKSTTLEPDGLSSKLTVPLARHEAWSKLFTPSLFGSSENGDNKNTHLTELLQINRHKGV